MDHNGLGYNNLINIYMLIKLNEVKKGVDFRILCLEEPEAHLHPAMQYKLFKYLCKLDKEDKLNQQIFVSTHSSNISAVAGLDNMFMINYNNSLESPEVEQQSLEQQFQDMDGETVKEEAKRHLTKFLDVTRSDMLFADKVILVEGLAEKLMMPLFMEKCGIPYEDEHISVVEIGGKNFMYFVELFNGNTPISIRDEIVTNNNVTWVRAFRFIFMLWNGYHSGSLYDIISAINLYTKIDRNKLSVKAIFQLDKIAQNMFSTTENTTL